MGGLNHWVRAIDILAPFSSTARLEKLRAAAQRRIQTRVVLDNVQSFDNIGAIMRTCDGYGVGDVHVVALQNEIPTVHPFRTSMGAESALGVHLHQKSQACIEELRRRRYTVCVAHLTHESVSLDDMVSKLRDRRPLAFVVGNEVEGVSAEFTQAADIHYKIPMSGLTQSFNVGVSVAVTLEHLRTRHLLDAPVSPDTAARLFATMLINRVPHARKILAQAECHVPLDDPYPE